MAVLNIYCTFLVILLCQIANQAFPLVVLSVSCGLYVCVWTSPVHSDMRPAGV